MAQSLSHVNSTARTVIITHQVQTDYLTFGSEAGSSISIAVHSPFHLYDSYQNYSNNILHTFTVPPSIYFVGAPPCLTFSNALMWPLTSSRPHLPTLFGHIYPPCLAVFLGETMYHHPCYFKEFAGWLPLSDSTYSGHSHLSQKNSGMPDLHHAQLLHLHQFC